MCLRECSLTLSPWPMECSSKTYLTWIQSLEFLFTGTTGDKTTSWTPWAPCEKIQIVECSTKWLPFISWKVIGWVGVGRWEGLLLITETGDKYHACDWVGSLLKGRQAIKDIWKNLNFLRWAKILWVYRRLSYTFVLCYSKCGKWRHSIGITGEVLEKLNLSCLLWQNQNVNFNKLSPAIHRHIRFEKRWFWMCMLRYLEVKHHDVCNFKMFQQEKIVGGEKRVE